MISHATLLFFVLMGTTAIQAQGSSSKKEDPAKSGATLFRDKGCAYCHGAGGEGSKKAPALSNLWKDRARSNQKIADQILNGGQKMPPFRDSLTDEDIADLLAYLRAKKKPLPAPAETEDRTLGPAPQ